MMTEKKLDLKNVVVQVTGPDAVKDREPVIAIYFRIDNPEFAPVGKEDVVRRVSGNYHIDAAVDADFALLYSLNPSLHEAIHDSVDRALSMAADSEIKRRGN